MEIKNRKEIIKELADLIVVNESLLRQYQVDIYAYIDQDGNVELDEFINVGGNSWLNDDHYTLYRIDQTCNTPMDYYVDVSDVAEAAGISWEDAVSETAANLDCDADEIEDCDVSEYLWKTYEDKITEDFQKWYVETFVDDAKEKAIEAIEELEKKLREEEDEEENYDDKIMAEAQKWYMETFAYAAKEEPVDTMNALEKKLREENEEE